MATLALPKFLGGGPAIANDLPPVNREPSLDDLEYVMRTTAERVDRCRAALEQALEQHRDAEAAFVARAGRLLYHHAITPTAAEEGE